MWQAITVRCGSILYAIQYKAIHLMYKYKRIVASSGAVPRPIVVFDVYGAHEIIRFCQRNIDFLVVVVASPCGRDRCTAPSPSRQSGGLPFNDAQTAVNWKYRQLFSRAKSHQTGARTCSIAGWLPPPYTTQQRLPATHLSATCSYTTCGICRLNNAAAVVRCCLSVSWNCNDLSAIVARYFLH